MASYLERYQDGERQQVWRDLIALGPDVRHPDYLADAQAVARETMVRARHNIETLIPRLHKLGYRFHTHQDSMRESIVGVEQAMRLAQEFGRLNPDAASPVPVDLAEMLERMRQQTPPASRVAIDPLRHPDVYQPPDGATAERLNQVEATIGGPLPLSLRAFCEHAGAVSFLGSHRVLGQRDGQNAMKIGFGFGLPLDHPLVEPFAAAASRAGVQVLDTVEEADESPLPDPLVVQPYFEEWEDADEREGLVELSLAPDDLHKSNISGGDPYGMRIPNPAADGIFSDWNQGYFVDYLRIAFRWGGFPGFARSSRRPELELRYLSEGLLEI